MHPKEKPDHDREKRPELPPRRQPLMWGAEEGIWWKSKCHTCSDSPDNGGLSLLAIHQHCEAVGVLHAGGQPGDHDAAGVRDHLPRSLSALARAHSQLQGSKVCFSVTS